MQKACGIIAISAIALSASQFASAQTSSPDRSARTADQSSAAREAVKSTLRDAGFTNVRIMSESFLVHAIDQNGDPVVMVVRPDSRAIMPEASEGHDEANAPEPGYPDSLTDLSEDEDEATARWAHRQVVEDDRPPAISRRRGARGRRPTRRPRHCQVGQDDRPAGEFGCGRTGGGQSDAKPVGEDAWRAAEPERWQREDPRPPERHDDGDEWGRAGRAQSQHRATRWNLEKARQSASHQCAARLRTGATMPACLQLKSLPNSVSSQVPQVRSYHYAMVQNELLIVGPATKKIVTIITEWGGEECP
jgi:hypothetical protein